MIPPRSGFSRLLLLVGGIIFLGAISFANLQFTLRSRGGTDFLVRWVGTRSWITEGTSPYDSSVSVRAEQMIYGRPARPERGEERARFNFPLPAVLFSALFSLMPLPFARALWMTLLENSLPLLVVLSVRLIRWRPSPTMMGAALAFGVLWYPGFRAIVLGDFAAISAVIVVGGLLALIRGHDVAAGALFGLALLKPEVPVLLAALTVAWAVSRRRLRFLGSWGMTTLALIVAFLILRPTWPFEWLNSLSGIPSATFSEAPISVLVDLLPDSLVLLAPVLAILLLIFMLWEWVLAWGKGPRHYLWTANLTLVITQLAIFRTTTTNLLVLTPGFMLSLASWDERWGRRGRWMVTALLAIWLVFPWWVSITTLEGNLESPLAQLPIPLFILAGLLWTRWWAIRGRELIRTGTATRRWPQRA